DLDAQAGQACSDPPGHLPGYTQQFAETVMSTLPVDSSFMPQWFQAGGPAMWLLALLSVLSLATLLAKAVQFLRSRPASTPAADRALAALAQGNRSDAEAALSTASTPTDRVIARALD